MQGPWASLGGYSPSGGMGNQMMGWRPQQQYGGGYGQIQPQAMPGGYGYGANSGLGGILSGAFGGYGMGRQMMPMFGGGSMPPGVSGSAVMPSPGMMGGRTLPPGVDASPFMPWGGGTSSSPMPTTPSFPGASAVTRAMPWTPPPAQPVAPAPTPAPRQAPKPIAAPARSTIPQFALADDPARSMRMFMAMNRG